MKKNFGSAIVKKAITVAMAVMLLATTPVANVRAAEAETTTEVTTETTVDERTDAEKAADEIGNKLITDILTEANNINKDQHANDFSDDLVDVVEDKADAAIKETVDAAASDAADAVAKKDDAVTTDKNIDNYTKDTDKATYDDASIVGSDVVKEITYDASKDDADIIVKVTDAEGNNVEESLIKYTEDKTAEAETAAQKAKDIANNVTSADQVAAAQKALDEAKAEAKAAVDDAQVAYDSAVVALDKEIALYNAYVAKYYSADEAANLFKKDSKGEITQLSDKDLAAYLTRSDIATGLDSLQKTDIEEQSLKIETAEVLVNKCEDAVTNLKTNTLAPLKEFDAKFVENLESMRDQTATALEKLEAQGEFGTEAYQALTATLDELNKTIAEYEDNHETTVNEQKFLDGLKDFVEATKSDLNEDNSDDKLKEAIANIKKGAQAILDAYTKDIPDYAYAEGRDDNSAQDILKHTVANIEVLLNHFVNDTESELSGVIIDAKADVEAAQKDYDDAYATYTELQNKYENYTMSKLDAQFATLKAKLEAAEKDLATAKANLEGAQKTLADAEAVQITFKEEVKDLEENINNATTTTTTTTTTVNDTAVAATAFIADQATPLSDMVTITDEPTALLDSVPQTGDSMPAALPVAATGFVAMAGAMFLNLKKRFER